MKEKKRLTTRQWRLYDCLLANFPNKLSLEEIYEQMREYYPPVRNAKSFNNSHARRLITDDLTALEDNDTIQLIIVRKPNGNGIGIAESQEEANNYIQSRKYSLLDTLKRYWKQRRKLNHHNQMRLVFNKEREVCRAYIEQGKGVANG